MIATPATPADGLRPSSLDPVEYRPARPGEVGRNFARCDLARELLGYSPAVRIEDGIPRLWEWFTTEIFRDAAP